jgi:perosamine synthetase
MDFFHSHVSQAAIDLVTETLRSTFISEGQLARRFEEELARTLGLVRPVAVNSGTSALHLGLVVAGIGPGDEVILPPQTFVASGMAILMCGAKPVFADIQPRTGNIDPASVRSMITKRTKAIMPVHWGGYPCDMDEINGIAHEYGLAVLDDAAHALGATYKGRPVGSLSRLTAFSFQAIKHLTTGDGGALCCREECDYHEARRLRWFGIDRERDLPSVLGERVHDLDRVGFKYHLNDLAAAVGLGNLPDVPDTVAWHRKVDSIYLGRLRGIPGFTLLDRSADREGSCWFFTVLVEDREGFVRALKSRNIPVSVVHQRIDRNRVFGGIRSDLPGQRLFDDHQIALPIHSGLTEEDVDIIIRRVTDGW